MVVFVVAFVVEDVSVVVVEEVVLVTFVGKVVVGGNE